MRCVFVALSLASLCVYACSESTDGSTGSADGPAPTTNTSSPNEPEPQAANGSRHDGGKAALPDEDASFSTSSVIINEISGADEWVELVNAGAKAVDISGWMLADRDKTTGAPKTTEAATFPAGTILSPKSYALVRGGSADGGKSCPDGGQSYCAYAKFGISNKTGEVIFLIAQGTVVGEVVYPPAAAPAPETWCRLPNAETDGPFARCPATPGAPNVEK